MAGFKYLFPEYYFLFSDNGRNMPLTGAERQRRYRQKLMKENPEKYLKQKKENLERIKKQYKKINELTENLQKLRRKKWRKEKQKN